MTLRNSYSTYTGNATNDRTTTGVSVVAGDLIVVASSCAVGLFSNTCTDNAAGGSNSYTPLTSTASSTAGASGYVFAAIAKATETLSISVDLVSDVGMAVHVYAGAYTDVSSALSAVGTPLAMSSSASSATSNSISAPASGIVFVYWFQELTGCTLTENSSGFVKVEESASHIHQTFHIDGTASAGTYADSVTMSTAVAYNALIVSFNPVGGSLPTITAQPQQQTAASGSTATFSVTATGATSYQWQSRDPLGGSWSNVGTSSSSYTTGTLTRADSGKQYRCVVTNASGSVTSDAADVRVTEIPASFDGLGMVVGSSLSFVGDAEVGAIDSNDLTGSLNVTFAAMTSNGASSLTISGALASTFASLTLSGTGSSTITGSLSKTFADLTTSGTGSLLISGSAALALSDMSVTGTGDISGGVTGSASITFADLTASASGQSTIDGSLSATLGNLTASGTSTLDIAGSLSATFGALTVAGVSRLDIAGSASITFANMASNGSAELPIWGQGAGQMGPVTVAGSATIGIAGTSAVTFGAMSVAGAGALEFHGAASIAFAAMSVSGAGSLSIDGALSATFDDMTAYGESIITGGITGSAHIMFDAMTASGTGVQTIEGSLAVTLADVSVAGTGATSIVGSAVLTLDPMTVQATGSATEPITGQADIVFADMSVSGAGGDGSVLEPKYMGSVKFIPLKKEKKKQEERKVEAVKADTPPKPRVPGLVSGLLKRAAVTEIVNLKTPEPPAIVNPIVNKAPEKPAEEPHVSTLDPFYNPDPAIDRDLVLERMAQIESDLGARIAQLEAQIAAMRPADPEPSYTSGIDPFYTPPAEQQPEVVRKTRNSERAAELARKLLIDDFQ